MHAPQQQNSSYGNNGKGIFVTKQQPTVKLIIQKTQIVLMLVAHKVSSSLIVVL
jgi:hypothetical protein